MKTNKNVVLVKGYTEPKVDPTMRSYANDPFMIEKLKRAEERLKNVVLPVSK
jgi:hypothetical protein